MSKTILSFSVTDTPDFDGFLFLVESGRSFDVSAYAEAYTLNQDDIDEMTILAVQDAAARLVSGEWLAVTHDEIVD